MRRSGGIPEIPMGVDRQTRRTLIDMRRVLINLRGQNAPPSNPSNVKVTAQAFGNLVQWTRGLNSDFHEVLWNTTSSIAGAHVVNVGDSAEWKDSIGQSGITKFYWVRAAKANGARSVEIAGGSATTLASNVGVNQPAPPPQSQSQYTNLQTGGIDYLPRR